MRTFVSLSVLGAVAAAMASCSTENEPKVYDPTRDTVAEYEVTTSFLSLSANRYNANPCPPQFSVWACGSHENGSVTLLSGDVVSRNQSSGKYDASVLRIPSSVQIRDVVFFACADAGQTFDFNDGCPLLRDFIVASEAQLQSDPMYATQCVSMSGEGSQSVVNLDFRHALCHVAFNIQNDIETVRIIPREITIGGIANQGTYVFPGVEQGKWTDLRVSGENPEFRTSLDCGPVLKRDGLVNITDFENVCGNDTAGISNAFCLIPQKVAAYSPAPNSNDIPGDGAYFAIYLDVYNIIDPDDTSKDTLIASSNFIIPVSIDWKEDSRYVYDIHFPGDVERYNDVLTPMNFSMSVDDFTSVE